MDQPISLLLFQNGGSGPLCEAFLAILNSSLDREAKLSIEVMTEPFGSSQGKFFARLDTAKPQLVLLVVKKEDFHLTCQLIKDIKAKEHEPEIIVITEECSANEIFKLMELGATDFIIPPINPVTAMPRIWRLLEKVKRRNDSLQSLKRTAGMRLLVGKASSFIAQTKKIPLVANCDGRVLILGETGTGKELFARAIHYLSPRMNHPFVPVSCGAIPIELMENELFGHEKGAFTGAPGAKQGLISEAEGGTLFLDEVDSLQPLAQTKLLRFLQEGEYRPLGSTKSRQADVRVISASNMNPSQAVTDGRMRKDFYYRLNIVQLNLPPLRERREDIPLLAQHFLVKYAREFRRNVSRLSEMAMQMLISHDWPGNVRELENTIERAVMLAEGEPISESELSIFAVDKPRLPQSFQEAKTEIIANFERTYLQELMTTYHGNVSQAALAAKKNRRAFWELIRKHRIDACSYRIKRGTGDFRGVSKVR
jgi:two-component system response regulator GlrR